MRKPLELFKKITLLGVRDEKDFHERKKTQLLNTALAIGVPTTIIFSCINAFQGKPLLALINVLLTMGGTIILIINSYKKFHTARLILTSLASVLFTVNALLYRNGGEYFLIGNLIIIIIYFNDRRTIFWLCLLNCLLFIGIICILHTSFYYDSVSFGRVIFNISYTLVMISFSLIYFKTVQLKYMQEVEEKNKELELLNNTKQKLFSLVAHDLRSPIGRLKSSLEMLQKGYIDPGTFQQMTRKLTEEVNDLHDMLDNLLKWSISQLQGLEARMSVFELEDFIRYEIETHFRHLLEKKQLRIHVNPMPFRVKADMEQLKIILRNLIVNAIKYSYPEGQIILRAHEINKEIILEVTDEGIGMDANTVQSIFHDARFSTSPGTALEKGTGIGLKLSKELVEKNGGRIWVHASPGKGSSFYVSLKQS